VLYWDPDGLAVIYLGDGRVKIEALDIYGVLQVLYLPQEHWIKLVTGQAGGYGPYTGENFLLREGTPDLNTAQGRAEYKARANAVLENFFGPGTEITASHSDTNKVIVSTVVNGSLLAIGLPAGASSGFAIVRGLSYTAEAGLSGYAIYDGSGNIYEGIQDGNAGQVVWGTLETAAGALGGYGSVRALTGEIRAGLGSGALVVDDALLNAHVAESLGPVAQRNRLVAVKTTAGMGDDAGRYLYHYTSAKNANNILAKGFDTRYSSDGALYFTSRGNLSPLQAQIELALPANRSLPDSLLRIDVGALENAGISPFVGPRRVQGNLPGLGAGGGTEFLFNQNIPSQFIWKVR